MNKRQLSRIKLEGYKSIRECDLELHDLNILIGANGSGKSNFIGFFRMIQQMLDGRLQLHVSKQGGPDSLLHFGRKRTHRLHAELYFGDNGYKFTLEPTEDSRMVFSDEKFWWKESGNWDIASGHFESAVETQKNRTKIYDYCVPTMKSWRLFHFHDTGESAAVKQRHGIHLNDYLYGDARNLAAFLFRLQNHFPEDYARMVSTIQLAAPFFGDFHLRPHPDNTGFIELEWMEKGGDEPFKAHLLSDGTLRFICLVCVLMQPLQFQPQTILIDEPELGLHPAALQVLAAMLQSASVNRQIIISTQSTDLLSEFNPDDVIVADRSPKGSLLSRLDAARLDEWLKEYTLGELWLKNILGGRP